MAYNTASWLMPRCQHQGGASGMGQSSPGDRQPPGLDGGEELIWSSC